MGNRERLSVVLSERHLKDPPEKDDRTCLIIVATSKLNGRVLCLVYSRILCSFVFSSEGGYVSVSRQWQFTTSMRHDVYD